MRLAHRLEDDVNYAEIAVFLTLAEELHFGRTAERRGLSQPQVSRIIRSLEWQVGGALFERTSRAVRLTPLGEELRSAVHPSYTELQQGFRAVQAKAREANGILRVGCTETTGVPELKDLIEAFEQGNLGCRVVLKEVFGPNPIAALR